MDRQYDRQREIAESELERQIDNWQEILDNDECAAGWIEYIQRTNLEYQMEHENEHS